MSGFEVAGLVLGAVGLVTVFKEAYKLVKKHRQKRRIGLLGLGISDTALLEHEIHSGESSLVSRYKGFHAAYGDAFARGDGIATDRLKDVIIELQYGLIIALQGASRTGKLVKPSKLVPIAITGRTGGLTTLAELAQRLAILKPIRRQLNLYERPKNPSRKPPSPRLSTWLHETRLLGGINVLESPLPVEADKPTQKMGLWPYEKAERWNFGVTPTPKKKLSPEEKAKQKALSTAPGTFKCDICARIFGSESALGQHCMSDRHKEREKDYLWVTRLESYNMPIPWERLSR